MDESSGLESTISFYYIKASTLKQAMLDVGFDNINIFKVKMLGTETEEEKELFEATMSKFDLVFFSATKNHHQH